MSRLTLALALAVAFLLGVLFAAPLRQAIAAPPTSDEFSYLCIDAMSARDLNEKLNAAGARGWRVVSASPGPAGSVWCLQRYGHSPLQDAK